VAPHVAYRRDPPTPADFPLSPRGPVLVVSPHLDDAALNCAAVLDRREPLDVLTVFTGAPAYPHQSNWDRRTGFSSSIESMVARREEDRRAFQGSGHRLHHLGLHENAPHPRPDSDRDAISAAVRRWTEGIERGLVALPAGAGWRGRWRFRFARMIGRPAGGLKQHPDHVFVRNAALDALGVDSNCELLLYEEVPYSFSQAADAEVASVASRIGVRAIVRSIEVDRRRKANRIAAYRSQLPHLCPNGLRLDVPDSLPPLERYWHLTSA
jgi:LmbE family N-acetylglucosaminyl deacetylase